MSLHTLAVTVVLFSSLGIDTFGVALGLGMGGLGGRDRWTLAGSFALAEGLMPVLGFLAGKAVAHWLGAVASYLAIALLLGVGLYALWEGMRKEEPATPTISPLRVAVLALSISMDELAVGFSLGLFQVPIAVAVSYIAAQAFVVTLIGMRLGAILGETVAERAELLSGLALTGLGIFLLLERL